MNRIVSNIIIYPIKSLGGIWLNSSKLTERGLEHDRRWMLIDTHNRFLTIRQHAEFLFYQVKLTEDGFQVSKKDSSDAILIPKKIDNGEERKVKIWDNEVTSLVADDKINAWFTSMLGFSCKLVYLPDSSIRRVQPEWVKDEMQVSLADAYPYLVLGQASVDDLNSKIEEDITYQRFRPNVVVEGGGPYEEYVWKDISIGTGQLRCVKPCTRCIVTTMNPETAEQTKEPLKTLFKQRINDKMIFGQNAVMIQEGAIKVGDELIINSTKQSPYEPVYS